MLTIQFSESELAFLFEKSLSLYNQKKVIGVFLSRTFVLYFGIPSFQFPFLEYGGFRVSSLMEQRAIRHNLISYPKQSRININKVKPELLKTVLAPKYGSFFYHKGIDWSELNQSIKTKKRDGIVRRAGTITIKLAKNLYLTPDETLYRKVKELIINLRMEKELSKKAILQAYLNAVEWGNGMLGIKETAKKYFHKKPYNLSVNKCARLAAVIPSSLKHSPNSSYVSKKTTVAISRMNNIVISPDK